MMFRGGFRPGDPVVYRKTKHSTRPGPRARRVAPSPNGDDYTYLVDKFWVVDAVLDDGRLLLRTRRGKTRVVSRDDLNLRPASWWESLFYKHHFPQPRPDHVEHASRPSAHAS